MIGLATCPLCIQNVKVSDPSLQSCNPEVFCDLQKYLTAKMLEQLLKLGP